MKHNVTEEILIESFLTGLFLTNVYRTLFGRTIPQPMDVRGLTKPHKPPVSPTNPLTKSQTIGVPHKPLLSQYHSLSLTELFGRTVNEKALFKRKLAWMRIRLAFKYNYRPNKVR